MKRYIKPIIEDEEIEIEDICNVSGNGGQGEETEGSIWDELTPEN